MGASGGFTMIYLEPPKGSPLVVSGQQPTLLASVGLKIPHSSFRRLLWAILSSVEANRVGHWPGQEMYQEDPGKQWCEVQMWTKASAEFLISGGVWNQIPVDTQSPLNVLDYAGAYS